jgi:hypothetical protein
VVLYHMPPVLSEPMDRRRHFQLLDDGISRLLVGLPNMPTIDHDEIRQYIDHDEYGLALETLTEAVAQHGILLTDAQSDEVARLAELMGLPAP